MVEDFPLDPNAVQPVDDEQQLQEQQSGHIEVVSQQENPDPGDVTSATDEITPTDNGGVGEGSQVEDKDRARAMAEAGDESRINARHAREGTEKRDSFVFQDGSPLRSKTPEERAAYFDKKADDLEEAAGELHDEAQSSDYSNDPDKAKQMIVAERGRKGNLAAPTPIEAGNRYDQEEADRIIGEPRSEALKKEGTPEYKLTQIFLRYSRVIAENYRRHGDELTINLEALELAAKFASRRGTIAEYEFGEYVGIKLNDEKEGAIDITTGGRNSGGVTEKWHIPMFDDDPKGHSYSGTYAQLRDFAYYEVTSSAPDPDGEFDKIHTTKTRSLDKKDIANLKKLFGKVSDFAAAREADALRPGDEDYERELAEINYGRD